MNVIDTYLNMFTMYRVTLYYLILLACIATVIGFTGKLPYSALEIAFSSTIFVVVCFIANFILAKLFRAVTNIESVFITALILTLIVPPTIFTNGFLLIFVGILAMASKYLLTVDKRHVFNPAAIGVYMTTILFPNYVATWWIGNQYMLPFVVIGGFLVVRKIRRERMVLTFLGTFFVLSAFGSYLHNGTATTIITTWQRSLFSSAVIFFSSIMLTEPLTSPPTKKLRSLYGVLVGILYATPLVRLWGLVFTPEVALLLGNVFSYIVSPKYRFILKLVRKIKISPDTYLFDFGKIEKFAFIPGQYFEWTLPHPEADGRGNRRYFSIASAPHENLMMAVKFYEPSSSFKKALLSLPENSEIIATGLAGDFVLPKKDIPLVLIAGGVGMAPFRSILEDIVEKKRKVDIVVIFANKRREDIIFGETLKKAEAYGVRTVYVLTDKEHLPIGWNGYSGHITEEIIQKEIPDHKVRNFMISGPQLMVQNFEKILISSGVPRNHIHTDFFPGYSETTA